MQNSKHIAKILRNVMHICMNWDAINFDWNRTRAFLVTAKCGTLSGAARELGQQQSTVGRQIAALEDELNVVLFERIGKRLSLTPNGAALLPHVEAMASAALAASLTVAGQSEDISGTVTITASDVFSAHILPPLVAQLQRRAPKLHIKLIATNEIENLQQRDADIALRHQRPAHPELTARLLRQFRAHLFASKSYVQKAGLPADIADLKNHDFVAFGEPDLMVRALADFGIDVGPENFCATCENGLVAWELVRAGLGIAAMTEDIVEKFDDVVRILPEMQPIEFPLWLVCHRELHSSKKIRLVFDFLAKSIA